MSWFRRPGGGERPPDHEIEDDFVAGEVVKTNPEEIREVFKRAGLDVQKGDLVLFEGGEYVVDDFYYHPSYSEENGEGPYNIRLNHPAHFRMRTININSVEPNMLTKINKLSGK